MIAAGYERVQYSVYLGLTDPRKDTQLWSKLLQLSEAGNYQLMVIPIPVKEFRNMEIVGDMGLDLDYLTGTKHTLII